MMLKRQQSRVHPFELLGLDPRCLDGLCPASCLGIHKLHKGFGLVAKRLETVVKYFGLHVRQRRDAVDLDC